MSFFFLGIRSAEWKIFYEILGKIFHDKAECAIFCVRVWFGKNK